MTRPADGLPRLVPDAAMMALLTRAHGVVADQVAEHVRRPPGGGDGNADPANWAALIGIGLMGLRKHGMAPGAIVDLCMLLVEIYTAGEPGGEPDMGRDAPPPAG
jgi:hypothetical protein